MRVGGYLKGTDQRQYKPGPVPAWLRFPMGLVSTITKQLDRTVVRREAKSDVLGPEPMSDCTPQPS